MSTTENIGYIITTIGIFIIIIYSLTSILDFYGITSDTYGIYIVFYLFLLISCLTFNRYYDYEI